MGTHYNGLVEAVLKSTHNLCFEQEYEKISEFLSDLFLFLLVKFSIYLNRRVFVMVTIFESNFVFSIWLVFHVILYLSAFICNFYLN